MFTVNSDVRILTLDAFTSSFPQAKEKEFSYDEVGNLTPWQREADTRIRNLAGGVVFVVELVLNFVEPIFDQEVRD